MCVHNSCFVCASENKKIRCDGWEKNKLLSVDVIGYLPRRLIFGKERSTSFTTSSITWVELRSVVSSTFYGHQIFCFIAALSFHFISSVLSM